MLAIPRDINQGILEKAIYQIFPNERISLNSRGDLKLQNPITGYPFEVDILLSESNICFEFQDDYHYTPTWYAQIGVDKIKQKDAIKSDELRKIGLSLITVPFWWDGSNKSLISSILFQRPDLHLESSFSPIALNPSTGITRWKIPEVGELMLASFPSDILTFANNISQEFNWWMGEKYDGIRMCWVPTLRQSYTRSGLTLQFPFDVSRLCGDTFLDCEIWFGRGNFLEAQKLVYADASVINWSLMRVIAFDVPSPQLRDKEFEIRFKYLYSNILSDSPLLIPTSRAQCNGKTQLISFVQKIMKSGGEGVMLRKPASTYVGGRSDSLYKFKASIEDSEALVSKITDDHCTLKLLSGETIQIPLRQIGNLKLMNGDVVTYNYIRQGLSSLSPANIQIVRVRKDVTWQELVMHTISVVGGDTEDLTRKKDRKALEEAAKRLNLDPLSSNDWYTVPRKFIVQELPCIIVKYKGSLVRALLDLFPEIGLDRAKFTFLQKSYWGNVENRRQFFLSVAKKLEFDPLVAGNWYSSYSKIKRFKHGRTVVSYHGKSYAKALISLFPEINLQLSKFEIIKPAAEYWQKKDNRALFFRNYARFHSFDPLVAANWYRVTKFDILSSQKSARAVLQHHRESHVQALVDLFPNIGLRPDKFSKLKTRHWEDSSNRKAFFERFATTKGIDPMKAENWSLISKYDISHFEYGDQVLRHFNGSLKEALSSLFSIEIHSDNLHASHWENEDNRKKFFELFSKSKRKDPLSPLTWYHITPFEINSIEYGKKVLLYYGGDHKKALMELFPDIGLENTKFTSFSDRMWESPHNSRKYLQYFASTRNFDAIRDFEKWYSISELDLISTRYGKTIVWMHGGNLVSALRSLFPLKFQISKFEHVPDKFWRDESNRKELMIEITDNDPVKFWQHLNSNKPHQVLQNKYIPKVLQYYGGKYGKALSYLFPDKFSKKDSCKAN